MKKIEQLIRRCATLHQRMTALREQMAEAKQALQEAMQEAELSDYTCNGWRARFRDTFQLKDSLEEDVLAVYAGRYPQWIRQVVMYRLDGWAVRRDWNSPERQALQLFVQPVREFEFGPDRRGQRERGAESDNASE